MKSLIRVFLLALPFTLVTPAFAADDIQEDKTELKEHGDDEVAFRARGRGVRVYGPGWGWGDYNEPYVNPYFPPQGQ